MKFGLKIIGQLPQISAPIFKNVSEKKIVQLYGKKLANNDLNMIARTIKNQLLLVSCSSFNEKPNSEFLQIISTIHIVSTSKNNQG